MLPESNRLGADAVARDQVALTQRQQQALSFINQYIATQGYPPSRYDICDAMGFSSPNSAQEVLGRLQAKGWIEVTPRIPRGIKVIPCKTHRHSKR